MNTPQQVAVVKAIIKIKKRILYTSEPADIAVLIKQAIDLSADVPANTEHDTLDRTKSKGWNIIALKRLIKAINESNVVNLETLYSEVSAILLRLSMVFVHGELDGVNKILSESFLTRSIQSINTSSGRLLDDDN